VLHNSINFKFINGDRLAEQYGSQRLLQWQTADTGTPNGLGLMWVWLCITQIATCLDTKDNCIKQTMSTQVQPRRTPAQQHDLARVKNMKSDAYDYMGRMNRYLKEEYHNIHFSRQVQVYDNVFVGPLLYSIQKH
jgi:hypothetical protein